MTGDFGPSIPDFNSIAAFIGSDDSGDFQLRFCGSTDAGAVGQYFAIVAPFISERSGPVSDNGELRILTGATRTGEGCEVIRGGSVKVISTSALLAVMVTGLPEKAPLGSFAS